MTEDFDICCIKLLFKHHSVSFVSAQSRPVFNLVQSNMMFISVSGSIMHCFVHLYLLFWYYLYIKNFSFIISRKLTCFRNFRSLLYFLLCCLFIVTWLWSLSSCTFMIKDLMCLICWSTNDSLMLLVCFSKSYLIIFTCFQSKSSVQKESRHVSQSKTRLCY